MQTTSDLTKTSTEEDDRNLAQNGNDRHYWYSVRDMMTLLVNARKERLSYNNYNIAPILGEEYSSLRPNDQRLLVADPYHQDNFAQYLADDINKIIGNGEHTLHAWEEMPNQIIIPLLSGAHWRAIRIEINYIKKSISILWDDPYGEGHFLKGLKDKLRESIIINVSKLIRKETSTEEFTLNTESITEVDKVIDQQGLANNAWDCGPIIISNIVDYIKNFNIRNTNFKEYSIKAKSDINHEQQIVDSRKLHIDQFTKVSGEPRFNARLQLLREEESRVAEEFIHKLGFSCSYKQQIAQLSPSKVNMLFTLIETNRGVGQAEEYSELEIKIALDYIDRHVMPISLDQHYDDEDFDINSINDLLQKRKPEFNKLSFAIGTDNFAKITESGKTFIDKSLLIKEIIETGDEVTIITRPRRWGKTTNLDMLAKFFAIEVDAAGSPVNVNQYRELFQNLRIGSEYSGLVAEHQGQYPVIFFTFKNVKSNKYKEIEANLIDELQKLYDIYAYLGSSEKLRGIKKDKFKKYLTGEIKLNEIVRSIEFLSSLLREHHEKEVYLFIDEYDSLLNATYDTEEYENTLKMMRSMLGNALKGNNNLKKSVITGITKIAKAGLFSDVNNIQEYSILKSRYAEYFGFTEDEVQVLLQQAKITEHRVSMGVKEYYNGYNIGGHIIYNPWSIVSFLSNFELSSYWVNTEGSITGDRRLSAGLLMTPQMQEQVRELINNCYSGNKRFVEIKISPEVVLHQLRGDPAAIWTVLAYGGYLSLNNMRKAKGSSLTCQAKIPNNEVLEIYEDSILFWFRDILEMNLADIEFLNIENMEEFQNLVKKLLLQKAEIIGEANESLFHSFIDGLYLLKGNTHLLSSEKKAGSGRIDSIYYPIKGRSKKIIIHEYKILGKTDTTQIDAKIQEALWQVYEHYYFQELASKYNEFRYSNYQQVEIRGIVAFIDENNNNLGMRSLSVLHTMEEIISMLPFFQSLKQDDLARLKAHYSLINFVQEYRKVGSPQDVLNQLKPSAESSDEMVFDLGRTLGNSELAKRLWSEQEGNLFEMDQRALKKLKGVGPKISTKIIEFASSYHKTKTEEQRITRPNSYHDKHLTRYEKLLVEKIFCIPILEQYKHTFKLNEATQTGGSFILFSEQNHNQHSLYVSSIIDMINNKQINTDTIICLERKQYGRNLGMPDVIAIANYLDQGNYFPSKLQQLPIYHDAILYNIAKAKGIQVIGIEGKGLAHSKESRYYHQAREKYMAEQIKNVIKTGKKAVLLLGAQHASFIKKQALFENSRNLIIIPGDKNVADSTSFFSYIYKFIEYLSQDFKWQVLKSIHLHDKSRFESIMSKYGLAVSFDVLKASDSEFKKSVLLKLHPDKNPNIPEASGDFAFVINLREEFIKPFDAEKFINDKIQTIHPLIYQANIGFKAADAFIDLISLIYTPTLGNARKALLDATSMYSMCKGINGYSALINGADIAYKAYHGEYTQAFTQSITTVGYMLIPMTISYLANPYLGFLYGVTAMLYSGYNTITNAYSFYNEFNQKDFNLNSNIAYQTIAEKLSTTYLQKFYDFTSKAKEYEKSAYKIKLEDKGEFGENLYKYIHSRVIEEKYDIQNNLKTKHFKVIDYDHCMEIIGLKEEDSDHYYCYNEEQQILDHIAVIGESYT